MPVLDDELAIRPFTVADQAAVRQLILAGLGEHFGWIDETANPDLDDIAAHYLAQGHLFFVVEHVGAPGSIILIIATCGLLLHGDGTAQMVRVSVTPALRRRGIARRLVRYLIERAREIGCRRVIVETTNTWTEMIALYEGCGFREYDSNPDEIYLEYPLTEIETDS